MSRAPVPSPDDPRIHVGAAHLLQLGARARGLSLRSRQPARSILNGRHGSRLRGRGLDFEEMRGYLPGDDVRAIDWKVTARTGEPHVRVYTEERDRPVLLLVDQRMSMFFGSQVYMKSVVAAEAAAIVAARVLQQGDRIGGLVFGDDIVAEHRPQRRPAALRRLLASVARANRRLNAGMQAGTQTLDDLLQAAVRVAPRDALVMVFSDFDGLENGAERLLRRLAMQGELIAFNVTDIPGGDIRVTVPLAVSDGSMQAELDLGDAALRARIETSLRERLDRLHGWSRKYGFPVVPLNTTEPTLTQLLRLFGVGGTPP